MSRLDVPGRITGLDTARAVAILGMIATHVFPLMQADPSGALTPTWVGASLTGVSSALFVVLAGVGLTLLTKNAVDIWASRVQLSLRAIVLLVIGLLLGLVGSSVAIILVHYGVLFLLAMWFINLSKRALAVTAISWVMLVPFVHGVLTRFMQVQAGGATAYAENWRLWNSPTLFDVVQEPGLTLWDIFFTGYYPVISFLGYILIGMAIGRMNLTKLSTGMSLLFFGAIGYLVFRGIGHWLLTDPTFVARISHTTAVPVDQLPAMASTGAGINTDLLMGAPHWFGLAVPHSGAPLDIYSTTGAAVGVIGLSLVLTRSGLLRTVLFPLSATGMVALTAYVVHVLITVVWPTNWPQTMQADSPLWSDAWIMLGVHWGIVLMIGLIVYLAGIRGPLEAMLRKVSNVASEKH